MDGKNAVNIIGAGLGGLSAAITLARGGAACRLVSLQASERAQSVLAEGGINAALDTMGEGDSPAEHARDTLKGGCYLESERAVRSLCEGAPDVVRELVRLGVPFQSEGGRLILRPFGGQKKRRTAYARSSTGKVIMTALIDEARKYESRGLIKRMPHHALTGIHVSGGALGGLTVKDLFTGRYARLEGETILCTGGLNGFFDGLTTGTTQNTGDAAALAFISGVEFSDLEFVQYHPTTVPITGKRMLISEAARGEGGRLFARRGGVPWYFMEEKYPELGNLMPRDVVSREMWRVMRDPTCDGRVWLDMTGLSDDIWRTRLSDMRAEIMAYLAIDPAREPVPVSPGIHFFMGGMRVDDRHQTSVRGLYAAGEAACRYHGANRLGGNSMLGAIFGGKTAAQALLEGGACGGACAPEQADDERPVSPALDRALTASLSEGLGIVRDETAMRRALGAVEALRDRPGLSGAEARRVYLAEAMLKSALWRRESRGAHCRSDCPDTLESYRRPSVARFRDGTVTVEDGEVIGS